MPPEYWRGAGLLALSFILLFLYTMSNQFPYFYHTDEPGKVAQLVKGTRDFHHPQLMLLSTEYAGRLLGVEWTPQRLVEVGRWYSAVCSTLAVAGMVLLTARHAGWKSGFLVGVVAGLHPLLFELSHYMKEDCGLLFGTVWTLLALDWFLDKPSTRAAVLVGAMAGLAVSAKYIGLLVLGVAFVAILIVSARKTGWKTAVMRGTCFLLAGAAIFAAVNSRALVAPKKAVRGAGGEFRQMDAMAEKGSVVQTNYLAKIPRKIAPSLLLGAVGYIAAFCLSARRRSPMGWALLSFVAIYLTAIHFTPLAKDRYLLPVLMLMCVMAALAGRDFLDMARKKGWNRLAVRGGAVFAVLLALGFQIPGVCLYSQEFGGDSRVDMVRWIQENLPPNAVIAYDTVVGFSKSKSDLLAIPQRTVKAKRFVVDLGPFEKLREKGITHVVVAEHAWGNVFKKRERPGSRHGQRRQHYEELFEQGELLWEKDRGQLLYLHPGLRIYALQDAEHSG